jgi:DUF1009 family protein
MEGTDATIQRAGELIRARPRGMLRGRRLNLSSGQLTVIKVAKPNQDMRFDVPVVGVPTIESMIAAGATCLCVTAGKTLMFDRDEMVSLADKNKIAIVGI